MFHICVNIAFLERKSVCCAVVSLIFSFLKKWEHIVLLYFTLGVIFPYSFLEYIFSAAHKDLYMKTVEPWIQFFLKLELNLQILYRSALGFVQLWDHFYGSIDHFIK